MTEEQEQEQDQPAGRYVEQPVHQEDLVSGPVEFQADKKREYLTVRYRGEGTMRVDLMGKNEVRLLISPEVQDGPEDPDSDD